MAARAKFPRWREAHDYRTRAVALGLGDQGGEGVGPLACCRRIVWPWRTDTRGCNREAQQDKDYPRDPEHLRYQPENVLLFVLLDRGEPRGGRPSNRGSRNPPSTVSGERMVTKRTGSVGAASLV
jgi:hypothetical protein